MNLTVIGRCNLLKRLYRRLFGADANGEFHGAFMDYHDEQKEFARDSRGMDQDSWKANAVLLVSFNNLVTDMIPIH